jgi:peroxiredoxin
MALTITPQAELGQPIPEFALSTVYGKGFSKEDLIKGQGVLFVFMCSHCPYVKAIEDRLIQLGLDLKNLGLQMIGVCSNDSSEHPEDRLENLAKRAQEKNYSFEYLHDEDQTLAQSMGAVCTPDFFLYDQNGLLAYRGRLDDNWKNPNLVKSQDLLEAAREISLGKKVTRMSIPSMGCNIKWKS